MVHSCAWSKKHEQNHSYCVIHEDKDSRGGESKERGDGLWKNVQLLCNFGTQLLCREMFQTNSLTNCVCVCSCVYFCSYEYQSSMACHTFLCSHGNVNHFNSVRSEGIVESNTISCPTKVNKVTTAQTKEILAHVISKQTQKLPKPVCNQPCLCIIDC